jgi:nucleoside-triphosphatase
MRPHAILVTGRPGIGKTTLIRSLVREIKFLEPIGFYTEEIREQGHRTGFCLVTLSGERRILAHRDIAGRHRVGRYGVDLRGFEEFLQEHPLEGEALVVIDEIGRMECLSTRFRETVLAILDSPSLMVATIALRGTGFIASVKEREDVHLVEVTMENRDILVPVISRQVRAVLGKAVT